LLVTCAPQAVAEVLSLFRDEGFASAAVIGELLSGEQCITVEHRLDHTVPSPARSAEVAA
jgi:hypothetical protein